MHWLTYWVVFGFFSVIEYVSELIVYFVPMYYILKTAFLVYLMSPKCVGRGPAYGGGGVRALMRRTLQVQRRNEALSPAAPFPDEAREGDYQYGR